MNAIDFRTLIRQERAAARRKHASKNKGSHDDMPIHGADTKQQQQQQQQSPPNIGVTFTAQEMGGGNEDEIMCAAILPDCGSFPELSCQHILTSPVGTEEEACICIPPTISYIPNFLSPDNIFCHRLSNLLLRGDCRSVNWVALKHAKRRVALLDAQDHPLPRWLDVLCDALVYTGVFDQSHRPNHVLVNQYSPGEGILPHTDGPEYFSKTATLSIGGPVLLKFSPRLSASEIGFKTSGAICEVLLECGSLITFEGEAYSNYMHGIDECIHEVASPMKCVNLRKCTNSSDGNSGVDVVPQEIHRSDRVSLTFRHKNQSGLS